MSYIYLNHTQYYEKFHVTAEQVEISQKYYSTTKEYKHSVQFLNNCYANVVGDKTNYIKPLSTLTEDKIIEIYEKITNRTVEKYKIVVNKFYEDNNLQKEYKWREISEKDEKYKQYLDEKLTDIANEVSFDTLNEFDITQLEYDSTLHHYLQTPEFASKYQNLVGHVSEMIDF